MAIDVVRRGKHESHRVVLKPPASVIQPPTFTRPRYFMFAGLIFMPLTHEFVNIMKWDNVGARFRYYYMGHGLPSDRRKELVFINQVLPHDVNVGYHGLRSAIVERVNGRDIACMNDLAPALARPLDGRHVIEIDHHGIPGEHTDFCGTRIVLDAQRAAQATDEIVGRYSLPADRSDDLKG
jgi:hypothetical protein